MSRRTYGIVLGRFQPLHLGHMEYLEVAKSKCDCLVVGVTNPDTSHLVSNVADPRRSEPENNPFSYFQRHRMIARTLEYCGWAPGTYAVVPADVADLQLVSKFLPEPRKSTVFVTVYDAWGEEKARRLESLGYAVEILWKRSMTERLTSGTEIRERIRRGQDWEHLVPQGVLEEMPETLFPKSHRNGLPEQENAGA